MQLLALTLDVLQRMPRKKANDAVEDAEGGGGAAAEDDDDDHGGGDDVAVMMMMMMKMIELMADPQLHQPCKFVRVSEVPCLGFADRRTRDEGFKYTFKP